MPGHILSVGPGEHLYTVKRRGRPCVIRVSVKQQQGEFEASNCGQQSECAVKIMQSCVNFIRVRFLEMTF